MVRADLGDLRDFDDRELAGFARRAELFCNRWHVRHVKLEVGGIGNAGKQKPPTGINQLPSLTRPGLRSAASSATLRPCRSTSFIARNASRTAKSWFARAIGKERSVPAAVRRSLRKSFPRSHPPVRVAAEPRRVVPGCRVPAACAARARRIGTDRPAPSQTRSRFTRKDPAR